MRLLLTSFIVEFGSHTGEEKKSHSLDTDPESVVKVTAMKTESIT